MEFTVRRREKAVGTVAVEEDARVVTFYVDCPRYSTLEVLRCYGETGDPEHPLLIGVLEPADGGLRLRRALTRQSLAQAGCATRLPQSYYLLGPQDQVESPAAEEEAQAPAEPPPAARPRTGDPLLDRALLNSAVQVKRDGDMLIISCAFAPEIACPLAFAFTGGEVEAVDGENIFVIRLRSPDYRT